MWNVGRFDPAVALATIERERCTAWSIVPTTAWRVVNHPDVDTYDLSSVIQVGGGAAPISGALAAAAARGVPERGAAARASATA